METARLYKMVSTHLMKKINKTRKKALCLLLFIIILISIPFVIRVSNSIYLPHQSKTQSFSNPQNFYPYIIADENYKEIEVELINADGRVFKLNNLRSIDPDDINGYISQTPYKYGTENNSLENFSDIKKFKVVVTNRSNNFRIIHYGVWSHYVEEYTQDFIKRTYF